MRTATIREVQHKLARIIREVESGEEFQILRRKLPVARLLPVRKSAVETAADWSGHEKEIAAIFHRAPVLGKPLDEIVAEGRGDY